MSRLYDRVMEQGCSPLTAADLIKSFSGIEQWREAVAASMQEELGRPPSGDELAAHLTALVTGGRNQVSGDRITREELDGAVVISAEEVADYWATLGEGVDVLDLLDVVVPPFNRIFVEFQNRPSEIGGLQSWGLLIGTTGERVQLTDDNETPFEVFEDGMGAFTMRGGELWILGAALIGEWQKGRPVGPIARWLVRLDPTGRAMREGLVDGLPPFFAFPLDIPNLDEGEAYGFTNVLGPSFVAPALFAVSLMHCKNVKVRPVDPPERLSKKHERKTGKPLTRYHVLEIAPMRHVLDTEGEAQTKGLAHALHICRGHFKTFTEEAPLFGKRVGTYWWPAHVRGSAEEGVVEKDYRISMEGDGIGQEYREADEHVTVTPPEVRADDPDTSQRGLRAHNRVQNLLASALTEAGFSPRSPKGDEPDFDLAWVDGETVWVAEVKSTTETNEEKQMRFAIGQVLRYRQKLSDGGVEVRAMIAVEHAPFDETWIDLCGREGIALVWPEVMAQALTA